MTGRLKTGALVLDEMRAALTRAFDGRAERGQAVRLARRHLRPYLRNRFELVDATTEADSARHQVRLEVFDHADARTLNISQFMSAATEAVAWA